MKDAKQLIDGLQEEYKKINHGKLTEGTRNGRRWKKWGNGKKKRREAGRPPCCGVARETAFYGVTATRGGIGRHRAPEVTCYLAGSMWPGAEFNTKWSLRCCSLCQRSNKSDYNLSLQCVPIPLLDLHIYLGLSEKFCFQNKSSNVDAASMCETDLLTSQHMRSFSWHLSQLSLTQIMNNLASVSHTYRVRIAVFGLDGCQ